MLCFKRFGIKGTQSKLFCCLLLKRQNTNLHCFALWLCCNDRHLSKTYNSELDDTMKNWRIFFVFYANHSNSEVIKFFTIEYIARGLQGNNICSVEEIQAGTGLPVMAKEDFHQSTNAVSSACVGPGHCISGLALLCRLNCSSHR